MRPGISRINIEYIPFQEDTWYLGAGYLERHIVVPYPSARKIPYNSRIDLGNRVAQNAKDQRIPNLKLTHKLRRSKTLRLSIKQSQLIVSRKVTSELGVSERTASIPI